MRRLIWILPLFLLNIEIHAADIDDAPSDVAVSMREDIRQLQEKIGQFQTDVRAVQVENESLRSEVTRLKKELSAAQDVNAQHKKDVERLETLIQKVDSARQQDRKVIIDQVSEEIGRLSRKVSDSSQKSKPSQTKTEVGVEHVVEKGDTLKAIAKAYGVTKQAIMEANHLKTTELKTGQKLFIPKS